MLRSRSIACICSSRTHRLHQPFTSSFCPASHPCLSRRALAAPRASSEGAEGGGISDDEPPPVVLGDWRQVRYKMTLDEGRNPWGSNNVAQQNQQLLQIQNPILAKEEAWAHPVGAPERGGLLLATPDAPNITGDQFMWQLVIFLIQHSAEGSIGLILNRPSGMVLGLQRSGGLPHQILGAPDGMQSAFAANRVYAGGYTRQDIFQLLHGHRIDGSVEVIPGVYLGGEAEAVDAVQKGKLPPSDFRFFSGATVWGPGQLTAEIEKGTWYTAAASRPLILKQCLQLPTPLWMEIMQLMGGEYAEIARAEARYLGDE